MKENRDILFELKLANKPVVPDGFFNHFSDEVLQLIALEDSAKVFLNELDLKHFKNDLKSNYGVDFEKVKSNLDETPVPKKGRQIMLYIVAAAACMALLFSLPFFKSGPSELESNGLAEEVLLSYLDEEDLISFMVSTSNSLAENDIQYSNDILFEELEDELYNYLNEMQ